MNLFKKIAEFLGKAMQVAGVAYGLLPMLPAKVQQGASVVVNDLTNIGGLLVMIQTALSGATGADKLKAALPLVVNAVKSSEMVSGHQVQDEARFVLGSQEILQGVYDVLNSLKADNVKSTGQGLTIDVTPVSVTTTTVKAA